MPQSVRNPRTGYKCKHWHYRRIQDFIDDSEAKNLTNYKKTELERLLRYFELPEWIFVPITNNGEHCYKFY
jgi:hypothetical protein